MLNLTIVKVYKKAGHTGGSKGHSHVGHVEETVLPQAREDTEGLTTKTMT